MGWNGSGTFERDNGVNTGDNVWEQDKNAAVKITAARHDTHDQDLADGIANCLAKDGQNAMTDNLNMGAHSIVNYGPDNLSLAGSSSDTYTPEFVALTGGSFSYINQTGSYAVIDKIVIVNVDVIATLSGTVTSGALSVTLPFTADPAVSGSGAIGYYGGIPNENGLYAYVAPNSTRASIRKGVISTNANQNVVGTELTNGQVYINMTITYTKA